jgi:hypothetical protein
MSSAAEPPFEIAPVDDSENEHDVVVMEHDRDRGVATA